MTLTMSIADHILTVSHRYPAFAAQCADFRLPDSVVSDLPAIAVDEDAMARECERMEGGISPEKAESMALERAVAEVLSHEGVAHLHAVVVAVEGAGYLFFANSGVGKSTHAAHWLAYLGDRARVVCDDKPFLSRRGDVLYVHGSPWRGKEGAGESTAVPLAAVGVLHRAPHNKVTPCAASEAVEAVFSHAYLSEDPAGVAAILPLFDSLVSTIPFYHIHCTDQTDAAVVAYRSLHQ